MDLAEIGERAFAFALVFSLVATIIVISMLSAGLPPDMIDVPLFAPATMFYSNVQSVVEKIPQNATPTDLVGATAAAFIGGFLQFILTMLTGLLLAVYTIASVIPPEVRFLVFPLYFVAGFLQMAVWHYVVSKVFSMVKSWLPGG